LWSVRNAGSIPNADPNYHTEGDTPEKVDYENAVLTVKLTWQQLFIWILSADLKRLKRSMSLFHK